MESQRSNTADKIIVDRTKAHRNSDVAKAVRRTRDRLSQRDGSLVFDREMLKLHVRAVMTVITAVPVIVLAIGTAALLAGMSFDIVIWALLTVGSYAGLALIARRIERMEMNEMDPPALRRDLLIGHFVSGIGWAYFALLDCPECGIDQMNIVKAVILLMMVAATGLLAWALRGALFVTFALPVAVFAAMSISLGVPVEMIMAGLLVLSLPFFTYIAGNLNRSAVMMLSFRSEKDALFAELETAKSISDEARRRAEEANLAKSRFLASMSHELRTPLNAILGFSEVMANQVLGPLENEHYREYAGDIHESGQHLLNLINEILDLSRIEAGRYQFTPEPLYLADVAEECCHLTELKARNKDIRIIQQFEQDLPRLFADERSVRQIILNLLSNAIKFTPSGGEIRVRAGWTVGGGQYISVKDNGPGIPPDEIPVVLSAFGQGSIAIKSAEQGTGLGLPIVMGLAQLHGGSFDLKSKLREGTEAIVTFPASRVMEVLPAVPTAVKKSA